LIIGSHLGAFGIVTVGRIKNMDALVAKAFARKSYFSDTTGGTPNPTEIVAMLICQEESFEAGIRSVQEAIQGSCSLLLLTEKGLVRLNNIKQYLNNPYNTVKMSWASGSTETETSVASKNSTRSVFIIGIQARRINLFDSWCK